MNAQPTDATTRRMRASISAKILGLVAVMAAVAAAIGGVKPRLGPCTRGTSPKSLGSFMTGLR